MNSEESENNLDEIGNEETVFNVETECISKFHDSTIIFSTIKENVLLTIDKSGFVIFSNLSTG